MILVVDASVACKWFIAEAQADAAAALLGSDVVRLAPDLIVPEVCNVARLKLRSREITAEQAGSMVDRLPDFLSALVPTAPLAARAFDIAGALRHPAYDCFYIALAEQRGTRLVTADRRLFGRSVGTPWAALLVALGDAL